MIDGEDVRCEVCDLNDAVGVCAVPAVPISVAYCAACLAANAHPMGILVANTAMIGGLEHAAPFWVEMVQDTLTHLGKDREAFDAAVRVELAAYDEFERRTGQRL